MDVPTLILCYGGSPLAAQATAIAGIGYGAQLPDTVYGPLTFADQNWRRPDRAAYMAAVAQHRPDLATVLDWEYPHQRAEVLDWAEEVAGYVQRVLIIPKCGEALHNLPRQFGNTEVGLAYSVPTTYGATTLPLTLFAGWPIHLLGGNPLVQRSIYVQAQWLGLDVQSMDGNYLALKAHRFGEYLDIDGRWKRSVQPTPRARAEDALLRSCHTWRQMYEPYQLAHTWHSTDLQSILFI